MATTGGATWLAGARESWIGLTTEVRLRTPTETEAARTVALGEIIVIG